MYEMEMRDKDLVMEIEYWNLGLTFLVGICDREWGCGYGFRIKELEGDGDCGLKNFHFSLGMEIGDWGWESGGGLRFGIEKKMWIFII